MTFEQSIETHLISNGLFSAQARAIIDEIKSSTDISAKSIAEMFTQDVDGYPEIMRTVIMISVNSLALDWLNKNAPQHWARPMFMTPSDRGVVIRGNHPCDINI